MTLLALQVPEPVLALQAPVVALTPGAELLLLRFAEAARAAAGCSLPELHRLVRAE